ncbi:1-acyl-sn-glycerol-3-phosphate acyltransferase delta [Halotydeus destructor]|nr:1-acyl-sn-glycerol-3-phosphate acyltransferase delta [Halotydeus destructor]
MLLVTGALGQIWLISGLILNVLQAIAFVTVRPISKQLFRRINYGLTYANFSQLVVLGEWLSGSRVRVFFADQQSADMFGKELTMCVSNHKYEVDWLWTWLAVDKFQVLGYSKAVAKKSLRWMPIMGWCWYFGEFIFLARDWTQDSLILGQCLDTFIEYSCPLLILMFCEGTRYTKEKYEASIAFAKSKGYPLYKHHLVPRGRGFVYCLQHLTSKKAIKAIYNIQIGFHDDHNKGLSYTLATLLNGQSLVGDVYIERIPIEKIDLTSEETINEYLRSLYSEKDALMEYHIKHARFPGQCRLPERRLVPLINTVFWTSLVTLGLVWVMSQGTAYLSTVGIVFLTGIVAFFFLVRTTRAKRGSAYGASPKATPAHVVNSKLGAGDDQVDHKASAR